ncbi:MAG TPA: V-type ATP synthase subunit F [Nitrospiria bacterium]
MRQIVALVDEDTGLGFRLAGIEARPVENPSGMERELERVLSEEDIRIAIVDEVLFRDLPEKLVREAEARTRPVVLPVPTIRLWQGVASPEEYVARLIRRSIGYQIKIKR